MKKKYFILIIVFLILSVVLSGCDFLNQLFGKIPVEENNYIKINGFITVGFNIKLSNKTLYILKYNNLDDYNSQNIDTNQYDNPLTAIASGGYKYDYTISNLIKDNYVIIAFLDINDDGKLNFDSSGNPVEPVGFSKMDSNKKPVLENLTEDSVYDFSLFSYYEEDECEENDSIDKAYLINPPSDSSDVKNLSFDCLNDIDNYGDVDWFYFSASAASVIKYLFKISILSGDININNVVIEVWDDNGKITNGLNILSTNPLEIEFIPSEVKIYYLKIYNTNSEKGNYKLEYWSETNS